MLTRDLQRRRYVVDFRNVNRITEEPPHLYGRNAVDTTAPADAGAVSASGNAAAAAGTGSVWEAGVAMPLTEEDENGEEDEEADGEETPNAVRVRVDTYTSDDVFEEGDDDAAAKGVDSMV